ncbi:MAG: DUF1592 domain-containing protein [Myxococcota bacterium]|nr:DUF1592 domain-containing protein [Myxococcota bacterium]
MSGSALAWALSSLSACSSGVVGDPITFSAGPTGSAAHDDAGGVGTVDGSAVVLPQDGGPPPVTLTPASRLARLSHTQLVNTYRDLLGLPDVSAADTTLSGDTTVGYDNQSDSLFVTDQLWKNLQTVANQYAHAVATTPALLARLVPAGAPTDPVGKAKAFIQNVGLRAYRRPLTAAEVQQHLTMFNQGPALIGGTDAFAAGAEVLLEIVLQSPNFLYRMELSNQPVGNRVPLNDYEVATKVSYAVTNTMPDGPLFDAAAQGRVANSADLTTHVTRLLATPAAKAANDHFHFQTYRMGVYDNITKDPAAFPKFAGGTGPAMRQEHLAFLDWVFDSGKGVADIFTSPVSFANDLLAPIYGLQGTFTGAFQQVNLDPSQRGGLLTQLGFLAAEASATDVDSIHRGVFVNQRVLCVVLPPVSPLAKPLPPVMPNQSDRNRVESFTGKGTCGETCHAKLINPPGFAFENYDGEGAYRTMDRGQPVNAADSYPFDVPYGTQSYNNGIEFGKILAKSPQAHSCYVQSWATYLYARPVADAATGVLLAADAPTIEYLAQQSLAKGLAVRDLLVEIATSDAFLARAPGVN